MFRALLCPSSGARDCNVDYHIGRSVRVADFSLQPGHYSSLTAPNLQHTANQERNDQCGNIFIFIYLLQLECYPVTVVILHVNKT